MRFAKFVAGGMVASLIVVRYVSSVPLAVVAVMTTRTKKTKRNPTKTKAPTEMKEVTYMSYEWRVTSNK